MAAAISTAAGLRSGAARFEANTATRDPVWVKAVVLTLALGFFAVELGLSPRSMSWLSR